jgi:cytochrome c-type biogenesis protein CcmE
MGNIDSLRGKRLQVHGNVVDGSIEQAKGTLLYRFKIESRPPRAPAVITATYNGLVPDTFKSGAEVVAKGTLTPDNQLAVVPDGIMAKCPSKYDADKEKAKVPAGSAEAAANVAAKL